LSVSLSNNSKRVICEMKLKSLRILTIIMVACIPSLFVANQAKALPPGVPAQPCGTLSNPSPGALCYTVTPGGGKVSAGGAPQRFSTIIQSTEPEYVIAAVIPEVLDGTGNRSGPTVNQISPGGTVSNVSVATNKLRELKQTKTELQAKAKVLTGPALIEAQAKLNTLSEEERIFEDVVTATIAAGQDAGKFDVRATASSRSCGWGGFDTCGSWIHYNIYVVRRYVGNPIAAYNRAFLVSKDAQQTIDKLVAEQQATNSKPESVSRKSFKYRDGIFINQSGTDWLEKRDDGSESQWVEVGQTSKYVQLFDDSRKMKVRILSDRVLWTDNKNSNWQPWPGSEGSWQK
jgi:hypothetical protein